jgi:hypothetical protein
LIRRHTAVGTTYPQVAWFLLLGKRTEESRIVMSDLIGPLAIPFEQQLEFVVGSHAWLRS